MADTLRPSLRELAETFRADLNGGSYSVDMIPTTQVVEKEIIRLRAMAIRQVFMPVETRKIIRPIRLNSFWCLSVNLKKDKAEQPEFAGLNYTYSRFRIPPVISINDIIDGVVSVSGVKNTKSYRRLSGGFAQYMQRLSTGSACRNDWFWIEDGYLNTSDNDIQYITFRGCPEDPTEWQTWDTNLNAYKLAYNPDTDPFLVTSDVSAMMQDMFKQKMLSPFIAPDQSINGITQQNDNRIRQ